VAVPSVVGLTEANAQARLTAQGFKVGTTIDQTVTDQTRVGKVLKQDPPARSQVTEGSTVTLTVGKAPPTRAIPDVTQYTSYEVAARVLTSAGFKPSNDPIPSDKP